MNQEQFLKEVTGIRRQLHMHPEEGFSEFDTSHLIEKYIKELGIEVISGIAGTGVIGILRGRKGMNSIAVRADMDCLEVTEQTDVAYVSKIPGLMHACGHDGHVAALLGLAKYLSKSQDRLDDDVVFIFQPAEEGPGGAKPIVESGVLDNLNIKAILAMHIFPEIEQGRIGCCQGPITARNAEVDIKVNGKSAHGALPHTGIDSIIVMSQIIQCVQTITSRRIDPMENAVITFGKMYGGEVRNVIAGTAVMEGTIRAFNEDTYNKLTFNLKKICEGAGVQNGCQIDIEIRNMYLEVFNDKRLFNILMDCAGSENVDVMKPLMIGEDFSYYQKVAPELMFFLGSRNEKSGYIYPLHSSRFNFDERILMDAISIFSSLIISLDRQ